MKKNIYIILIITVLYSTLLISYKVNINNLPKNIIKILEYKYNKNNYNKIDIISLIIKNNKYKNHFIDNNKNIDNIKEVNNNLIVYNIKEPIIYIYNTHTNEEYSYNKNNLYNITPTVLTASYILESELNKLGINEKKEKNNVTDIINNRGISYSSSYKVSRELLENSKLNNPSLMFFIDLHRDSVSRSITTTNINNITYAKTMFLLGLENNNYIENKNVMEKLNNYLNSHYNGLSRGIYEKGGYGVNGIYNQDFNKNTILIEVGGVDNTIDEVSNSLKVIAEMLVNYLKGENKTILD